MDFAGRLLLALALFAIAGFGNSFWNLPGQDTTPRSLRAVDPGAWKFEHFYLVNAVFAIVVNTIFVCAMVGAEKLESARKVTPAGQATLVVFLALFWGIGVRLFSYAIQICGIAVGFAVCLGLVLALGSLYPLLFPSDTFPGPTALGLLSAGIVLALCGLAATSFAVYERDRGRRKSSKQEAGEEGTEETEKKGHSALVKLGVCVVAGIVASLFNIAVLVSQKFGLEDAWIEEGGLITTDAGYLTLLIVFPCGFGVVMAFTAFVIHKDNGWGRFMAPFASSGLTPLTRAAEAAQVRPDPSSSPQQKSTKQAVPSAKEEAGGDGLSLPRDLETGGPVEEEGQEKGKGLTDLPTVTSPTAQTQTVEAVRVSVPVSVPADPEEKVGEGSPKQQKEMEMTAASLHEPPIKKSMGGETEGLSRWGRGLHCLFLCVLSAVGVTGQFFVFVGANSLLGKQGLSLGWALFMSTSIIFAQVWGLILGEWRGASGRSHLFQLAGVGLLIAGIAFLGAASSEE